MSFAVLGSKIGKLHINEAESITTSFPTFKEQFNKAGGNLIEEIIITIDGPAASGKGRIAKYLAKNIVCYI